MPTPNDTRVVRQWARSQGLAVTDRGRLPGAVLLAYREANGTSPAAKPMPRVKPKRKPRAKSKAEPQPVPPEQAPATKQESSAGEQSTDERSSRSGVGTTTGPERKRQQPRNSPAAATAEKVIAEDAGATSHAAQLADPHSALSVVELLARLDSLEARLAAVEQAQAERPPTRLFRRT